MYQSRAEPMPVAMVIGAHPAIYYASGFTSSYGLDELEIAGALLNDPIRLVKCETIDIEVPAEAELVIEGEVLPAEMTEEGPFGEATGTYAMEGSTDGAVLRERRDGVPFPLPPPPARSLLVRRGVPRYMQNGGVRRINRHREARMT